MEVKQEGRPLARHTRRLFDHQWTHSAGLSAAVWSHSSTSRRLTRIRFFFFCNPLFWGCCFFPPLPLSSFCFFLLLTVAMLLSSSTQFIRKHLGFLLLFFFLLFCSVYSEPHFIWGYFFFSAVFVGHAVCAFLLFTLVICTCWTKYELELGSFFQCPDRFYVVNFFWDYRRNQLEQARFKV